MKIGNRNEPDELVQLKRICGDYGIGRSEAIERQLTSHLDACDPGVCAPGCTAFCQDCTVSPLKGN